MRTASQDVALQIEAQRTGMAMIIGTGVFALVLIATSASERPQAPKDLVVLEMRCPITSEEWV